MAENVLSTETAETSWGDVHVMMGKPGESGAMSTTLEDLGSIDAEGLSFETTDGAVYQLKDINGKLIDELRQEPDLAINFTLLKPSEATRGKFWDTEVSGTGNDRKQRVKSLITQEKYSLKLANPSVTGSETFEAPCCLVTMKPAYSSQKGSTAECTARLLKGQAGYLFDFGVVAAAV